MCPYNTPTHPRHELGTERRREPRRKEGREREGDCCYTAEGPKLTVNAKDTPSSSSSGSPVRVRSLQHTGHGRDCCPQPPPLFQQALLGAEDRGGLLIHFSRARESPRTEGEKRRGKGASAAWKKVLWPRGRDRLSVQPKGRECFPPFPPSMQWPLMIALWVIFSTIEKKRTL